MSRASVPTAASVEDLAGQVRVPYAKSKADLACGARAPYAESKADLVRWRCQSPLRHSARRTWHA